MILGRSTSTGSAVVLASVLMAGCGQADSLFGGNGTSSGAFAQSELSCTIPKGQIFDGGPGKDGIPALHNPPLVTAEDPGLGYLRSLDRVIGVIWDGQAIAIPHNIGWWHEIVNLDLDGVDLAVSFCPLTGSSLAFDRSAVGGATFGVSGLLYQNNLIMYDRNRPESLWPQMSRGARCGERSGTGLTMFPVVEMTWVGWLRLHPDTRVVSGNTGMGRDYTDYPYGSYDVVGNDDLLFPVPNLDRRRPLKERVLGIPSDDGQGGIAFPFGELTKVGPVAAIPVEIDGSDIIVLWDADAGGAMAFRPTAAGQSLTLAVIDDEIQDAETGSTWDVDGFARSGPLEGERLEPVAEAYVAFWFAWAAFNTDTQLWTGRGTS